MAVHIISHIRACDFTCFVFDNWTAIAHLTLATRALYHWVEVSRLQCIKDTNDY